MRTTRLTVVSGGRVRHLLVRGEVSWACAQERAGLGTPDAGWWVTPWPGATPEPVDARHEVGAHPLVDGAQLHPVPPRAADVPRAPVRVVVAAGPDSGRSTDLRPGSEITVGRDPSADLRLGDPMVSRFHVTITTGRGGVTVTDAGSTNGTWLDDEPVAAPLVWRPGCTLRAGGSRLVLSETDPERPTPHQRTVARRARSPEVALPAAELRTPARSLPQPPTGVPVLVWVIPLLVSGALAAVLRMPYLLLFGLMAPAMSLGTHLSERRRHRRETERAVADHVVAVERTRAEAEQALESERAARERRAPAGGLLVARLLDGDLAGVWTRSRDTEDGIRVRAGLADLASRVVLDGTALPLQAAPVELDLRDGVTVRGPVATVRALCRSLLVQALLHHPPGDLALDVPEGSTRGPAWEWVTWTPHRGVTAHTTLRVVEAVSGTDAEVLIASSRSQQEPTRILVNPDGDVTITRPGVEDVTCAADLVGGDLALSVARCLTSVRWLGQGTRTTAGPSSFRELHPPADPDTLTRLWRHAPRSTRFTLGSAPDGPVTLDLAVDGPHVLVGGTTGSGKSELLRSLVTSLAAANRPDELVRPRRLQGWVGVRGLCAASPHQGRRHRPRPAPGGPCAALAHRRA
jgi:S-DNA-T family DNA segregation ATPase FtsK/SpoIIIE